MRDRGSQDWVDEDEAAEAEAEWEAAEAEAEDEAAEAKDEAKERAFYHVLDEDEARPSYPNPSSNLYDHPPVSEYELDLKMQVGKESVAKMCCDVYLL